MDTLPKFAFFGTPHLAVWVLDALKEKGIAPSLIVTNPDSPQGRKLVLTPSAVAQWAEKEHVPVIKPSKLDTPEAIEKLSAYELFIVVAYGKMIPQSILDIPKYKTINVHPSLLPKLRGSSPVRTAILEDHNPTGVTVMILTAGMDEGPILAQKEISIPAAEWPLRGNMLDETLFKEGAQLLADTLPRWIAGEIVPKEQDHAQATYSKKITKEMGLLDLTADPYQNLLKIRAFDGWPGTYFFHEKDGMTIRVKVTDAEFQNGKLIITKVIPEGKKEMHYEDFLRNNA